MHQHIEQYAYHAEAALDLFAEAHLLRQEPDSRERLVCGLYARAGRSALTALCVAEGLHATDIRPTLLPHAVQLDDRGLFRRRSHEAFRYARLLSRVLILDLTEAGIGYVTRDLFDRADAEACERAATFFLDICTQRLLRCAWDDALIRFLPFRSPPMVDTTLWARRARRPDFRRS